MCLTPAVRTGELFDLLRDGRPWTRAQLADATGLARSTITARIDTLMRLGLVAPFGGARSTGGRPPALFAMNPAARLVVGVDVGATHARVALTDLDGTVLGEVDARLAVAEGPERVLTWVVDSVRGLVAATGRPESDLAAIGIGLPGPVEHSTGRPINPPIMPGWDRYDVPRPPAPGVRHPGPRRQRRQHHGARRAPPAPARRRRPGAHQGRHRHRRGHRLGRRAAARRPGHRGRPRHVRVPGAEAVQCRCGNSGCLEAVAAGPAPGRGRAGPGRAGRGRRRRRRVVRRGSRPAMAVVRQAGRDIGEVVATMVNLINPSVVVIGGQVADAGEHLLPGSASRSTSARCRSRPST